MVSAPRPIGRLHCGEGITTPLDDLCATLILSDDLPQGARGKITYNVTVLIFACLSA